MIYNLFLFFSLAIKLWVLQKSLTSFLGVWHQLRGRSSLVHLWTLGSTQHSVSQRLNLDSRPEDANQKRIPRNPNYAPRSSVDTSFNAPSRSLSHYLISGKVHLAFLHLQMLHAPANCMLLGKVCKFCSVYQVLYEVISKSFEFELMFS